MPKSMQMWIINSLLELKLFFLPWPLIKEIRHVREFEKKWKGVILPKKVSSVLIMGIIQQYDKVTHIVIWNTT